MTLKFEGNRKDVDDINLAPLQTPEMAELLTDAQNAYSTQQFIHGYSPLTIGTSYSQVGRFIQFLRDGEVIPEKEQ